VGCVWCDVKESWDASQFEWFPVDQIAKEAKAQELILTHFSARYPNVKILENEARSVFPNTHAAEDFKVFPFPKNPKK